MSRRRMIREFWFGDPAPDGVVDAAHRHRWFQPDPAFDHYVREHFQADLRAAAAGRLRHWERDAEGMLALILLFDQFARNMFRDTPRAFMFDARAVALSDAAVAQGLTADLWPVERAFVYMPYQHAEDTACQDRSVELFGALVETAPSAQQPQLRPFLQAAEEHREVIRTFGRFPWRNAILERVSTAAERLYLDKVGNRSA